MVFSNDEILSYREEYLKWFPVEEAEELARTVRPDDVISRPNDPREVTMRDVIAQQELRVRNIKRTYKVYQKAKYRNKDVFTEGMKRAASRRRDSFVRRYGGRSADPAFIADYRLYDFTGPLLAA